jgi:hypothetical protein
MNDKIPKKDVRIIQIIKFFTKVVLINNIDPEKIESIISKCMKINKSLYTSDRSNKVLKHTNTNSIISHKAVAALVKCGDPRNKSIDGEYPYYTSTNIRTRICDMCSLIMGEAALSFSITLESIIYFRESPYKKMGHTQPTYTILCNDCNSLLVQKAVYIIDLYSKLEYKSFIKKYIIIKRMCRRVKDLYDSIIFSMYQKYIYDYDLCIAKTYEDDKGLSALADDNNYILGLVRDVINNSSFS